MRNPLSLLWVLFTCFVFFSFHTPARGDSASDSSLTFHRTCSLEAIWKDKGSGADLDGFFYLPQVEGPAFIIGGYGKKTRKLRSADCVLTVGESEHLVEPDDWELIWKDTGTGARRNGSMWRAIPPNDDYVCVGTIPQKGYEKPDLSGYRCVHASFTEKITSETLIWSDKGSGAEKEVSIFKLPGSGSFVAAEGRMTQLETYDLKVASDISEVGDNAETVGDTNTQDSGKKKGKKKSFGGFFKDKKLLGAVGGMVAGAIVADVFNAPLLDTIITIGLGAVIQGELADLIRSDEENRAIAAYIESQSDGETATITREDETNDLHLTTDNTRMEDYQVTVVRKKEIDSPPKLELLGEKYKARVPSKIRRSPIIDSAIIGELDEGETFDAVGKVIDENWYLIGKDNVAMGYVHGDLVALIADEEIEQVLVLRDAVDLDSLGDRNESGVVDLDELTVADKIEVNTSCKEIMLTDGDTSVESTVCKGSDGAWEIT